MLVWPKEEDFKINNDNKRQIANKRGIYIIHINQNILERLITLKEQVKMLL